MQYVPVVSSTGKPLMPCHPARARELVRKGRALRRFNKGIFYIKLVDKKDGETQDIVVGIDPGGKKEGFTVKSTAHTYLNIQADAVTWVKKTVKTRRVMRNNRRDRNTPNRKPRSNRKRGGIPPSTLARWQWKLRICWWLGKLYPINRFVVEDIKARTKGKRHWDESFSPLEVGKVWFYGELRKLAPVETKHGWETKGLRDALGLKKSGKRALTSFDAHCVDSWVLANSAVGGHTEPENRQLLCISPLQLHRRQLHRLQPGKGGIRKPYGGTRSLGFKRGSWVKHPRYGVVYVGGTTGDRISLYSLDTGQRLCQNARPEDCTFLTYSTWRAALLPDLRFAQSFS